MSTRESYKAGTFCWVDLMSSDVERSKRFYCELFGWSCQQQPTDMGSYTMFLSQGKQVAGVGPQPADMQKAGVPPVWSSYVCVDDANAVAARAAELGGRIVAPVMQVMTAGRMAVLADREGATFGIWEPGDHHGAQLVNEPGAFCWNELYCKELETAKAFYAALFGWTFETHPGDEGGYTSIANDGDANGGIMQVTPQMEPMPPSWAAYFAVAEIERAQARVKELGGQPLTEVMRAPEVGTFCMVADDLGAAFLLIQLDNPQ